MNSMRFDRHFLSRSIFNFFSTGMDRDEIIANLLLAQKNYPDLYPCIDYRTVDFWIESFRNKNFDLSRTPTHPNKVNLQNLPVIDRIIHSVNVEDQKSLYKSCGAIGNFIENQKRLFNSVEIDICRNTIKVEATCGISKEKSCVYFKNQDSGCKIVKNGKLSLSEKDFMRAGLDDFKEVVGKIHTKIRRLVINHSDLEENSEHRDQYIYGVAEVLGSLKEKVHVERLEMKIKCSKELLSIAKEINPTTFSSLIIKSDFRNVIDMEEIVVQPFWKHLKELKSIANTKMNIISTSHISDLLVCLVTIPMVQEVVEHKNRLLENRSLKKQEFKHIDMAEGIRNYKESLKPFTPVLNSFDEVDPFKLQYPYPGKEEKHLVIDFGSNLVFYTK